MMRCSGSRRCPAWALIPQQIIAEVGATAATFPSPKHLASWMGACPVIEVSAGVTTVTAVIDPDDGVRRRDLIMSLSRVVALTDRWC